MGFASATRSGLCALALLALLGCASGAPGRYPVPLGQELTCAGMTYRVLGCSWAHQLTVEGRHLVPTHNFLVVRLEVTNAGSATLPAQWLPEMWLVDEHKEVFAPAAVAVRLEGALLGSPALWRPTEKVSGLVVFDVPQALYHLRPEGCPPLDLACWWPERFGD